MKQTPLKRNKPLVNKAPMRRTPFKRPTPLAKPDTPGAFFPKSTIKRKSTVKRPEGYRDDAATGAVRGQPCYLVVPGVCLGRWGADTVVPCHSNQSRHGKGKGLKAKDIFTVPGCRACHSWIDQNTAGTPKQEKYDVWDSAYFRWSKVRLELFGIPAVFA